MSEYFQWLLMGVTLRCCSIGLWIFFSFFFFLQLAYSFREALYFGVMHSVHICMVLCENGKKTAWSTWAAVLPTRSLQALETGRGNAGASVDHFQGPLPCAPRRTAHSPRRTTLSTWRKFLRVKSHKFDLPLKPRGRDTLRKSTCHREATAEGAAPACREPGKAPALRAPVPGPAGF